MLTTCCLLEKDRILMGNLALNFSGSGATGCKETKEQNMRNVQKRKGSLNKFK